MTGKMPIPRLKLQSAFAGRVGQLGDSAVELVRTTIETCTLDAERFSFFGDLGTDDFSRIAVTAVLDLAGDRFVASAGRSECLTRFVIDQLAIKMLVASLNACLLYTSPSPRDRG